MTPQTPPTPEDQIVKFDVGVTRLSLSLPPKKFSEIMEEIAPQGTNTKLVEWVDKPIVVHSARFFVGSFGPAAFVIFTDENGELFNTVIGQKIVLPKLWAVRESFPVQCTIVRKEGGSFGEYYDIE